MSIFSADIVTSEIHVPLRVQFATELSEMIKKNRFRLLDALKTHGIDSVLNCIHMYVCQLKMRPKYESMTVTGKDPWLLDPSVGVEKTYCTYIKGNIFIVIHTGAAYGGRPRNVDEYGNITIVLDKNLRETTFRLTEYNTLWNGSIR